MSKTRENKSAVESLLSEARAFHQAGNLSAAIDLYEEILAMFPNNSQAIALLSVAKSQLGDYQGSIQLLDRAMALKPDVADAYHDLGLAFKSINKNEEAVLYFKKAIAESPDYLEVYGNMGTSLQALSRHEEALECYQKLLVFNPNNAELYNNLATVFKALNRMEEAILCFKKAIALKPDFAVAYFNLGLLLHGLNRLNEAFDCYDMAQKLRPNYFRALIYKGLVDLSLSRFEAGWHLFENRWLGQSVSSRVGINRPVWQGESIVGKKLLIVADNGYGDEIQMLRYISIIEKMGAQCWVQTMPLLERLVKRSFPESRVIGSLKETDKIDYFTSMLSLPLLLKTFKEQDIPRNCPYLIPDPLKIAYWSKRLKCGKKLKVGIFYRGNPNAPTARTKAIPLESFFPLFKDKKVQFILLQKDMAESEYNDAKRFKNVMSVAEDLTDFDDSAAVIMTLDLVITIDSAIAHLAGALNKAVWVLLPFSADWRWLTERTDSPWYPSARLFRQSSIGDWAHVIDQVKQTLNER